MKKIQETIDELGNKKLILVLLGKKEDIVLVEVLLFPSVKLNYNRASGLGGSDYNRYKKEM